MDEDSPETVEPISFGAVFAVMHEEFGKHPRLSSVEVRESSETGETKTERSAVWYFDTGAKP